MKKAFYRRSKFGPQLAYKVGLAHLIGRMVLLLTTTGRKSGLPRVTPLQYECLEGVYHVASVFGTRADWVRNLQADPRVQVQVGNRHFSGTAEVITDPGQIADFIQYRRDKHPRLIGAIMRLDGLAANPSREALLDYARSLALVKITRDNLH